MNSDSSASPLEGRGGEGRGGRREGRHGGGGEREEG